MKFRLFPALLVALALVGCDGLAYPARQRSINETPAAAPASPAYDMAPGVEGERASLVQQGTSSAMPQVASDPTALPSMVIRTGQASIQVDSLEVAIAMVQALATRAGGYIANSQTQTGGVGIRSATLEIRVPSQRFDALITGLAPIGKVESVNISAQDVGEEFTDVTARVANGRRLEQRLIDLLATRTGKLSDVLAIERELARVREEIERMEGRLRYLRAHVATSSLSVTVHEPGPIVGEAGSLGVIGEAFLQAWRNFVGFVAGFISSLGVVLPLGALAIAGMWGVRKVWRARGGAGR